MSEDLFFVSKCQQICFLSADVSRFVFRQQASAKQQSRRHIPFSASQISNRNDFASGWREVFILS
jgi:hypothetical protein